MTSGKSCFTRNNEPKVPLTEKELLRGNVSAIQEGFTILNCKVGPSALARHVKAGLELLISSPELPRKKE